MRWRRTALTLLASAALAASAVPAAAAGETALQIHADGAYLRGICAWDGRTVRDLAAWAQSCGYENAAVVRTDGPNARPSDPAATGQVLALDGNRRAQLIVTGDVLGTGRWSLAQIVAMARGFIGGFAEPCQQTAADLNGDGAVSVSDLAAAARRLNAPSASARPVPTPPGGTQSPVPDEEVTASAQWAQTSAKLVNEIRERAGAQPLTVHAELTRAAEVRVAEIIASGQFSHTRPDGTSYATAADGPPMGENLARIRGYADEKTVEAVVQALAKSESHLRNMVEPRYVQMGAAYAKSADGTWYACHLYAGAGTVTRPTAA